MSQGSRKRKARDPRSAFAGDPSCGAANPTDEQQQMLHDQVPETNSHAAAAAASSRGPSASVSARRHAAAAAAAATSATSPSSTQAGVVMVPCSSRLGTSGLYVSRRLFPQSQVGDTVPLTITVQPHDSSWDAAAYVSSTGGTIPAAVNRCFPQAARAASSGQLMSTDTASGAQQLQPGTAAAAAGLGLSPLGPYSGSLRICKRSVIVSGLPAHASTELKPYTGSWDIVLQEKVDSSSLVLHIKPGDPLQQASRRPARAQPGTLTGINVESTVRLRSPNVAAANIPKSLLASQFPGAAFPLAVLLTVNDSSNVATAPGAAAVQGADASQPAAAACWGPELFPDARLDTTSGGHNQPLKYKLVFSVTPSTRQLVGRSISHIAAHLPNSLTLHLAAAAGPTAHTTQAAAAAPAAAAAAAQHAGGGGSLTAAPVSSPSSSRSVKRQKGSQQQEAAAAASADAATPALLGGHQPADAGLSSVLPMAGSQGRSAGNGPAAAAAAGAGAAAAAEQGLMQWFDSDADDSDGAASSGANLEGTAEGTYTSTGHAAAAATAAAAGGACAAPGQAASVGAWQLQGSLSAAAGSLGPTGAAGPPVNLTSPRTHSIKQEPLAVAGSPTAAEGTAAAGSGSVSRMSAQWLLPPGLVLRDAADPLSMKQQLQDLLDSLEGLVAPEQLASWMEGVQDRMQPFRRQQQQQQQHGGAGAGMDQEWGWLLTDYRYLQRAVAGRQLQQVAKALSALLQQA